MEYTFRWKVPGLTFTRRMGELLEAMERLQRAVALRETATDYGIAIDSPSQRVTFSRSSLKIALLGPEADVPGGVWEVVWGALAPEDVFLTKTRSMLTAALPHADYDAARAHFARSSTDLAGTFEPTDAAILLDVSVMGGGTAQVEYGVVEPQEARERLSNPRIGMAEHSGRQVLTDVDVAGLSAASVFADVNYASRIPVDSSEGVLPACASAGQVPITLVEKIRDTLAISV